MEMGVDEMPILFIIFFEKWLWNLLFMKPCLWNSSILKNFFLSIIFIILKNYYRVYYLPKPVYGIHSPNIFFLLVYNLFSGWRFRSFPVIELFQPELVILLQRRWVNLHLGHLMPSFT